MSQSMLALKNAGGIYLIKEWFSDKSNLAFEKNYFLQNHNSLINQTTQLHILLARRIKNVISIRFPLVKRTADLNKLLKLIYTSKSMDRL